MCEQVALQHTATHCSTLQHTATHCNTLQQYVKTLVKLNTCQLDASFLKLMSHFNTLQHAATHCKTLQHDVSFPLCKPTNSDTQYHSATHCNTATLFEPTNTAMLSDEWQISSVFLGALICISRRSQLYFWTISCRSSRPMTERTNRTPISHEPLICG